METLRTTDDSSSNPRTFTIIFLVNIVAAIAVAATNLSPKSTINATAANLAISSLARQELFINGCYRIANLVPRSAPLAIRKAAAEVFHYGGLHSGCGVSSLMWFIFFVGAVTHRYASMEQHGSVSTATLTITYVLLIVLLAIVTLAYPDLRVKYHDWFDHGHRLLAWTAIALFWTLLFTSVNGLRAETRLSYGSYLANFASFWFTIIATLCVISPWLWLRRVEVFPEKLSDHAIRLHFKHRKPGRVVNIKLASKLTGDWHSFAAIPSEDHATFSALVSNAGDWTNTCIHSQPTKLWTRGYPIHNAAFVGAMFQRLVVVATGSGIGPIMALLASKGCPPTRVLWQTRNVRETYSAAILDRILQADPDAVIVDTDTDGRHDILTMTWNLVVESSAEAVIITSNPTVTKQVVFDLEARGIAAYGPIFDS